MRDEAAEAAESGSCDPAEAEAAKIIQAGFRGNQARAAAGDVSDVYATKAEGIANGMVDEAAAEIAAIDTDGDGQFTKDDLVAAGTSEVDAEAVMGKLDVDDNGSVDVGELAAAKGVTGDEDPALTAAAVIVQSAAAAAAEQAAPDTEGAALAVEETDAASADEASADEVAQPAPPALPAADEAAAGVEPAPLAAEAAAVAAVETEAE